MAERVAAARLDDLAESYGLPLVERAKSTLQYGSMPAPELVGRSAAIVELVEEIERIARSDAKVLITGERGVGKRLVAHAIHAHSRRSARPFLAVNCAGLTETLLESELFGHVKGSFTGADHDKPGKLELADNGTIFLDEVCEMPIRIQGLLLQFLETGELRRVGSDRPGGPVDVRLIAATNRDLRDMVARSTFREDLFYRLTVIRITVPPLRERAEDIPALLDHFWRRLRSEAFAAEDDAMEALVKYSWPGNVRELQSLIERLSMSTGRPVLLASLPPEIRRVVHRDVPTDFEIRFSPEFSSEELKGLLTALSTYYRACGGVGLAMTFEAEHVHVEEPARA